jgi:hypothetical protein
MNVKALGQDRICSVKPSFVYREKTGIFSGIFHFGARHSVFLLLCSSLNFMAG